MLDLKRCDLVDPPYLYAQISDSVYLEEDVQSPHNLLRTDKNVYCYMAKNKHDAKVKYPYQFYAKYRYLLKHHCVMAELIFSNCQYPSLKWAWFPITSFYSPARRSMLTIENLAMLTCMNKSWLLHEQLSNEEVKNKDIDIMEEYL